MVWNFVRVLISAAIIVTVAEISRKSPRVGVVLLSLPIVSLLALVFTWFQGHNLATASQLSRETLFLVPLTLPLFVPLAFARELGLGFWSAVALGTVASTGAVVTWLRWTAIDS